MATTTNVSTNYAGELAGDIFIEAFKGLDTINKNAITLLVNKVGTVNVRKTSVKPVLKPATCGFTPSGVIDYSETPILLKKQKIEDELCKLDFYDTFSAQAAGITTVNNAVMPENINESIMVSILGWLAEAVEEQIWQGTGTNSASTEVQGLLSQFAADLSVIDVTLATISSTNVVTEISKVMTAVPVAVKSKKDLILAVSYDVMEAYVDFLASESIHTYNANYDNVTFLGRKMVALSGLPANVALAYPVSNVFAITSGNQDFDLIQVKDMDEYDLSGNVRYKVQFALGVGYADGAEIVYGRK